MGCGESKHALATENTISKSKSKNSIEEKENLIIKEPGVVVVDVNVEEKENAIVSDNNGKGESRMEEKENVILLTDNGNGKSEGDEESVKEKEEKLDSAPVVILEGNKSDEISVHHHQVQEPEEEKLKRGHLNDGIVEGKAINQEVEEDSKTEEAIHIHVEEEKEVVVLPIAETKEPATKGGE